MFTLLDTGGFMLLVSEPEIVNDANVGKPAFKASEERTEFTPLLNTELEVVPDATGRDGATGRLKDGKELLVKAVELLLAARKGELELGTFKEPAGGGGLKPEMAELLIGVNSVEVEFGTLRAVACADVLKPEYGIGCCNERLKDGKELLVWALELLLAATNGELDIGTFRAPAGGGGLKPIIAELLLVVGRELELATFGAAACGSTLKPGYGIGCCNEGGIERPGGGGRNVCWCK